MRINVASITEEGLKLAATYDTELFSLEEANIICKDPVKADVSVYKNNKDIIVHVQAEYEICMMCARCLEEFCEKKIKSMDFYFKHEGEQFIDFTDLLRDEVITDYPMKPLCSDDCKGLCPICGQNLNEAGCSHNS